jgi:hypothetical protein
MLMNRSNAAKNCRRIDSTVSKTMAATLALISRETRVADLRGCTSSKIVTSHVHKASTLG